MVGGKDDMEGEQKEEEEIKTPCEVYEPKFLNIWKNLMFRKTRVNNFTIDSYNTKLISQSNH